MKGWALTGTRNELIIQAQLTGRAGRSRRGLEPTWLWCFDQNYAKKKKKNPCRIQKLKQKVNNATTCLLTAGTIGYSVGKKKAEFIPNFTDWRNSSLLPICSGQKISWNALLMLEKFIRSLKLHREMGTWKGGMSYGLSGFGINPLNNEIYRAAELNFKKNRSPETEKFKTIPKPPGREHAVHPWPMDINPLERPFPRSGRMEGKYFAVDVMWGHRLCNDGGALTE